ncbi:MAG: radical SAM protein, partial [Pseudomonadota bacterium]
MHHGDGAVQADTFIARHGNRIARDRRRGRAAGINPTGRFETLSREALDDGWQNFE